VPKRLADDRRENNAIKPLTTATPMPENTHSLLAHSQLIPDNSHTPML
jgi:hypothetical protein